MNFTIRDFYENMIGKDSHYNDKLIDFFFFWLCDTWLALEPPN